LIFSAVLVAPWAVWQLRHSFSIEPQARTLVTSGPYGISRHPIYVLHIAQTIGLWMSHRTLAVAAIVLISGALQGLRMHYEERVLSKAFPEYAEYRKQVDIFGLRAMPRIIRALLAPGDSPVAVRTDR
jgi:protein-S-isoprenylcysteine O-methyltransferase Ste14